MLSSILLYLQLQIIASFGVIADFLTWSMKFRLTLTSNNKYCKLISYGIILMSLTILHYFSRFFGVINAKFIYSFIWSITNLSLISGSNMGESNRMRKHMQDIQILVVHLSWTYSILKNI